MSEKSYVTIEQRACVVCGHPYDTGSLLLDKRMGKKFDRTTITGWGMCQEHQRLKDEGYVALVAVDESKSEKLRTGNIAPDGAYRTGPIAHLREQVFNEMFNVPSPEGKVVFCEPALIEMLAAKQVG